MRRTLPLFASLALPLFGSAAAAPAPDWRQLSDPGDFVSFSWDRASAARDGDVVRVVVRATMRVISPGPGYADFLTEIRCADMRTRVVRTTNYGRNAVPIVDNHPKAKFRRIKADHARILHSALCPAPAPTP